MACFGIRIDVKVLQNNIKETEINPKRREEVHNLKNNNLLLSKNRFNVQTKLQAALFFVTNISSVFLYSFNFLPLWILTSSLFI